jgi:uncharacterized repeat protein (TIGR01451 family)
LGDLAKGASAQITLTATAGVIISDILTNYAFVGSRTSDPNPLDNTAEQERRFSLSADLALQQFDEPDPVQAGSTVTYTLVVTNTGPVGAMDVQVIDTWPPSTFLVSATGDSKVDCSLIDAQVLNCRLGDMRPGANGTVSLVVQLAPSQTGTITNTATITSTTIDTNPLNNSDREPTGILPAPGPGSNP